MGCAIIGGTLTPFEGVNTYTEAGERMRQDVNKWIRDSGEFDAVVDFDAATRDPAAPTQAARRATIPVTTSIPTMRATRPWPKPSTSSCSAEGDRP